MIRSSIYFIRTKIFLLDIMEIRLVFHKFNQNNKTSSHLVVYKHLFFRLFMLISLKTVLNHWKKGKPWTWHILFNGFQQMLHFHGVLIFTWTTLSLSTRWLLVRNAGWIAHLLSFVNWSDLLSPLNTLSVFTIELGILLGGIPLMKNFMLLHLILFLYSSAFSKQALTWCRSIGSQSSIHSWWLFSSLDWCLWY